MEQEGRDAICPITFYLLSRIIVSLLKIRNYYRKDIKNNLSVRPWHINAHESYIVSESRAHHATFTKLTYPGC